MRWSICMIYLLACQPCAAADWWWQDFTALPNQSATLSDPNRYGQSLCALETPESGGTDCATNTPYGPSSSLSTQPPVILLNPGAAGAVRQVSAGTWHSLLLKRDGTVYGAGDNTYGQLGTGDNSTLLGSWTKVASGMRDITACSYFSLAIGQNGIVYETGDNTWGEQGDGTTNAIHNGWHQASKKDSSGAVSTMDNTLHVACGERHALAIRVVNGQATLWAIGDGTYGQTGRGDTPGYWQQVPLPNNVTPTSVAAGAYHSLFIGADQNVYGAGANESGQLGTPPYANISPFGEILPGPVVMVAAGYQHSIALMANGTWMVAGDNSYGQLGTNNYAASTTWKQQSGFSNVTQVAARDNQSFLVANQQLYATGNNASGQLGLNGPSTIKKWTQTLNPVKAVAPGNTDTLAIYLNNAGNQQVWATGDNSYGQTGAVNQTKTSSTPWVITLQ